MGDISRHRRAYLTADVIVEAEGGIVLVKRGHEPFKGFWALPAGFVEPGELIEQAAIREVKEETGLDVKLNGVVGVYSAPGRDPRGDVVTVCFRAERIGGQLKAASEAAEAKVFPKDELEGLQLAFDHSKILEDYFKSLKEMVG